MKLKIYSTDGKFYGTLEPSVEHLDAKWWNKQIFDNLAFHTKGEEDSSFKLVAVPEESATNEIREDQGD